MGGENESVNLPVILTYRPVSRGQGTYISYRCAKNGIIVTFGDGRLQLRSRKSTALQRFKRIVEESLDYVNLRCELQQEFCVYMDEREKLLCAMFREENLTLLLERHLYKITLAQFTGKLPVTRQQIVYERQEDLLDSLEKRGIYV